MQSRYLVCGLALLGLMLSTIGTAWAADDGIADIKTVEPDAAIIIKGFEEVAAPGDPVTENDVITTGPTGSVGMTFTDHSRISLGPNSEFRVSEYLFAPDRSTYSFVSNLSKGTMEYASGLVGKLAPETARVETPAGTIGIRGTRFLVRIADE
ncbi:MAG: hypothetical protein CL569_02350 [Alphaproteobacteria bacterium]|nr:hypothetical protein [Alphaproteobacteria bacterium]|tara:strand:- start:1035 stop:1493 length:459 start_codon:yes stop_codon:yes gene_type:complete